MHPISKFVCTVRNKITSLLILSLLLKIGINPLMGQEYNSGVKYVGLVSARGNVFYVGVPNNLEIHSFGINRESINIKSSCGTVEKRNHGFIFTCDLPGNVDFEIYESDNLIYSSSMRVKEIPKPEFYLLESGSKILNKLKIDSIKELSGRIPDFDYYVIPQIDSFEVILIRSGKEIYRLNNQSNKLNPKLVDALKTTEENDLILIEDIKYTLKYSPGEKYERIVGNGYKKDLLYLVKTKQIDQTDKHDD